MMSKGKAKYEVNTLHSDFRSDVVAMCVAESGVDIDNILILRGGTHDRRTDKEISSVELRHDYEVGGDSIVIKTNRRGIYDNLPEGLFHGQDRLRQANKETILDNMRTHNKEEFFIRRFFSLFEAEADRSRINIRMLELRYELPEKYRDLVDTMSGFWPVIQKMDTVSAVLFMKIIPYLSDIRCSYGRISQALTNIMGYEINLSIESQKHEPKIKYPRLGNIKLGVNSVLKGCVIQRQAVAQVTPTLDSMRDFLPGMPKRRMLETLLGIFLPDDITPIVRLQPKAEDFTARLADKQHPCILGVNVRLGEQVKSKNIITQ